MDMVFNQDEAATVNTMLCGRNKSKSMERNQRMVEGDMKKRHCYQCTECPYITNHTGTYNRHLLVHKKEVFKCEKCPFETFRLSTHEFHAQMHEEPGLYVCSRCNYKTKFMTQLHAHECFIFSCSECPFKTDAKNMYEEHILSHPSSANGVSKMYVCLECNFKTRVRGSMKLHKLMHTAHPFACQECKFTTTFDALLRMHKETHHSQKDEKMSSRSPSPLLERKLRNRERKSPPRSQEKASTKEFSCPLCGFTSSDDAQLKDHLASHDTDHEKAAASAEDDCEPRPFKANSLIGKRQRHLTATHVKDEAVESAPRKRTTKAKRKYLAWSTEDKKEVYWCHVFSRHDSFHERVGMAKRRRTMLLKRGVLSRAKALRSSDSQFQNMAVRMKLGLTRLTVQDIKDIERSVDEFVRERGSDTSE